MFFDTHAHLEDEQLWPIVDDVVRRATESGVDSVISVATDRVSSERCLHLANRFSSVYASVGVHPNRCHLADDDDWLQVVQLASQPRVVALGETGLDGYWDHCPMQRQREFFERHMQLSRDTGLPFIVHMRDCADAMIEMLDDQAELGPLNGIMHSFTGPWPMAERCIGWGMHISFAGMVTYKKNDSLREVASRIPNERLLIETDSPYLAPHPQRGQRPNEPALVVHTATCLAEVRGVTVQALAEQTTRNAKRLFKVDEGEP